MTNMDRRRFFRTAAGVVGAVTFPQVATLYPISPRLTQVDVLGHNATTLRKKDWIELDKRIMLKVSNQQCLKYLTRYQPTSTRRYSNGQT